MAAAFLSSTAAVPSPPCPRGPAPYTQDHQEDATPLAVTSRLCFDAVRMFPNVSNSIPAAAGSWDSKDFFGGSDIDNIEDSTKDVAPPSAANKSDTKEKAPAGKEGDIPSPSSYANYLLNELLLCRQSDQSLLLRSCSVSCCRLALRNLTLVAALSLI